MTSGLNLCKDFILEFALVRKGTFTVQPYPAESLWVLRSLQIPFCSCLLPDMPQDLLLVQQPQLKFEKLLPIQKITSFFKIPKRNFQGLSNTILFHLMHDETKRTLTHLDYICIFIAHINHFLLIILNATKEKF